MDRGDDDDDAWRIPTAMAGRWRRYHLPAIAGAFEQPLVRLDENHEYLAVCFEQQFAPNPLMDSDFDDEISDEFEYF